MFVIRVVLLFSVVYAKELPKFLGVGANVTVVEGRDATLACTVLNLQNYKVAWLRVDTQTILTIGPHVITKNPRVAVSRGAADTWALALKDIRVADGGRYMCQINTEPMIIQTHYLHVFVPPDIVESSGSEVMVREGENVTLHCEASGTPQPTMTWRREDMTHMTVAGQSVPKWSDVHLSLSGVTRSMNGAFLCIATNGVPPSVSKRITLQVLCKPTAQMSQKMFGGYTGDHVQFYCKIEANPTPFVYWTHFDGKKLLNGSKYQASISSHGYKHTATLRVNNVSRDDIGSYYCHAENSMGKAEDEVTLYTLATTTLTTESTVQTSTVELTTDFTPHDDKDYHEDNVVVVLSRHQMQSFDFTPST